PVTGRVNEAARGGIARILLLTGSQRVVPGLPDHVLDQLMNLPTGHARAESFDARVLSVLHDLVHLSDLSQRLALRDRPRHIRPVPRLFVLWKYVHDDRLPGVKRPRSYLVGVYGLRCGRADCAV